MIRLFFLLLFATFLASCTTGVSGDPPPAVPYGEADVDAEQLERDFLTWWTYFNKNTRLSDEYVALDTARQALPKGDFLRELTTGRFIPVKLAAQDSGIYLQLHVLSAGADKDIGATISDKARVVLGQFEMEGTAYPEFDYTTLKGQRFTNENTRGKLLILKSWFIGCAACIKEMPELNDMVKANEHREDIEFISLAYDPPDALRKFMTRKEFLYSVVPVERSYLESELQVYGYPTHFVVDKDGIIRKVVNSLEELERALKSVI